MKETISFLGLFCGFLACIEGGEPEVPFPTASFLSMPQAGLRQLDFSGKPRVKKEKQVAVVYKNTIKRGHVQDPELTWDWGFRTGIGVNTVVQNWNLIASYTKFHTQSFASVSTPGGMEMPTWQQLRSKKNGTFIEKNTLAWRLHLNLADLEIGKNITSTRNLSFRPHAGLRAAWVYQTRKKPEADADQISGNKQPLFRSNNCAGLGFRSGLDSLLSIGSGLSFFGDGALSFLAGYYNINQRKRKIQRDEQILDEKNKASNGIATAEVSLGMQYEKRFVTNKAVSVRLGYEMNYVFNQTRWMDWFSNAKGALSDAGSGISLQGLTVGLRYDF